MFFSRDVCAVISMNRDLRVSPSPDWMAKRLHTIIPRGQHLPNTRDKYDTH